MNTHRLRSLFSRQHVAPLTCFFLLIVVAVTAVVVQSSATAGGGGGQRPPFPSDEELKKDFDDDDLKAKDDKPGGKWTYATLLDSKKDDPSVPAYVRSIQLLSGGGKYQSIHKIKRVEVTNRSSRAIVLVQVRVEVFYFNEPEKILLEDTLPFAHASIAPNASQVVGIKTIYPPRLLKALARNGELYGDFGLRISVQEVRFTDGTFWRQPASSALLKSPYLDQSLDFRFPTLASLEAHLAPPFRSSDTKRADMKPCALEPRLAASAFSSVRFEFDTCTSNSAPRVDAMGRKNCGAPATSTCYTHCNDQGFCATWQSQTPCSGPAATPPTGTCAWPPPAPCCTPEMVTTPGTSIQFCRWNCKPPHCSTGTIFADGCYSVEGPMVCAEDDYDFIVSPIYGPACCPAAPTPTPDCIDRDGDGYGTGAECAGDDCDDTDPNVHSGCGGGGGGDCALRCVEVGAYCDPYGNCYTPVVVDTAGDGFRLTGAAGGVDFDIDGDGRPDRLGWTEAGSDDAWLALDRDGNGRVDDGRELFGDLTPQPPSADPNGFLALAGFDQPAQGGNGDGVLDGRDGVFPRLRLWRDSNHDGVSEPGELHTLPSLGVAVLELGYRESRRTDGHGNVFRYRAKVHGPTGPGLGRWAYDVFLVSGP